MKFSSRVIRNICLVTLLGGASATLSGCMLVAAGTAAGVATAAYVHGQIETQEQVALDRAWTATERALAELQFPVTEKRRDALQGQIIAETALGEKVKVVLQSAAQNQTKLALRVGTFGDEEVSKRLIASIRRHYW